jgi:cytochrome P450
MIHAGADTGEVTPQEAELLVRSLLSAGFDTTVHGLGAALRQLALNPDQFASLRDDPAPRSRRLSGLKLQCRRSSAPRRERPRSAAP